MSQADNDEATLVLKLPLGNPEGEALASQDGKLELPEPNSQAGGWELTESTMLLEGWCLTKLGEIAEWGSGGTPSRKNSSFYGGNVPWIKTGDLGAKIIRQSSEFITEEAVAKSSAKLFLKGSVAIAMYGATIGKTSILGIDATTNQACGVGQPIAQLTSSEFLYYFLCNEKDNFIAKGKGGAQPNISQGLIKEHEVVLPPLAEQQQITAKLDDLLAQVDTLKTRLDAIPKILKRFRQSVLAAAVSGKLTEDWRENNPGKKFLANTAELTEFRGKELAILPKNWQWLKFDQVASVASNLHDPLLMPSAFHIAPNHIESGTGKLMEYKTISEDKVTSSKHRFYDGQILYSKIRPYLCKVAIANFTGLCSADMYPINSNINTQFLFRWMLSHHFTDWASNAESRSVLPKINQKDLKIIPVPTPPFEEQTEIVSRVEQLFTYADQIEQRVKDAQAKVNHLTQAILAKAFRGELTADWREQNPDLISGENSAEALLAKIKAEREKIKSDFSRRQR